MGWQTEIFPLLIVVSGAPNTGLFVYNGPPAKGSLVAAIVAPGTTSDPYGNTVGAVANFGHWSVTGALLQHFGVDLNGDTFLANASGLTVQHGHSQDGSTWFYNSSGEGLGNLIASIAPAAGTDLAGNHYAAGISSYDAFGGQAELLGALFQLSSGLNILQKMNPQGYVVYSPTAGAGNQIASIAPAAFTDANGNAIKTGVTSYAGSGFSNLNSGLIQLGTSAFVSPAQLSLTAVAGVSAAMQISSGTGTEAGGTNALVTIGDSGTSGRALQVLDGKDGITYNTERIRQVTTSTQTFTLASSVAITGLSLALKAGTYHVHVKVPFVPAGVIGSSHNLGLVFTGTATANVNGQCFQATASSGAAPNVIVLNGGTLASTLGSPTHVAFPGWMDLEADVTVTANGTLTPNITLGTAGDNITTSAGTFWEINPES